jgi:hypothetical protein
MSSYGGNPATSGPLVDSNSYSFCELFTITRWLVCVGGVAVGSTTANPIAFFDVHTLLFTIPPTVNPSLTLPAAVNGVPQVWLGYGIAVLGQKIYCLGSRAMDVYTVPADVSQAGTWASIAQSVYSGSEGVQLVPIPLLNTILIVAGASNNWTTFSATSNAFNSASRFTLPDSLGKRVACLTSTTASKIVCVQRSNQLEVYSIGSGTWSLSLARTIPSGSNILSSAYSCFVSGRYFAMLDNSFVYLVYDIVNDSWFPAVQGTVRSTMIYMYFTRLNYQGAVCGCVSCLYVF